MSRLVPMLVLACLSTACAKTYLVQLGDQPPEKAHYVLLKQNSKGAQTVYDCRSMPDGHAWEPTCVKVDLRKNAPDASPAVAEE